MACHLVTNGAFLFFLFQLFVSNVHYHYVLLKIRPIRTNLLNVNRLLILFKYYSTDRLRSRVDEVRCLTNPQVGHLHCLLLSVGWELALMVFIDALESKMYIN